MPTDLKAIDVAIALICQQNKLLICQRLAKDRFGGLWEFPGGKVKPGETIPQTLTREVQEELGVNVTPLAAWPIIEHDYPDFRVRLHPFLCQIESGQPQPIGCQQAVWIDPQNIADYQFLPANAPLLSRLAEHFSISFK